MGGAAKKIGVSVVSLMLVVGCVIGTVAVVRNNRVDSNKDSSTNLSTETTSSSKTVDTICASTQYKDACVNSLQSVSNKNDASIKDYLEAAIKATIEEVRKSINVTSNVVVDEKNDPSNDKMGVKDCKAFLEQTIEQLEAAQSEAEKNDIHTIEKRTDEFIAWLTGAYIYQQTCVDEIENKDYKSVVEGGMKNATQLTDNALYIFAKIKETLGALDIPLGLSNIVGNATNKASRRLLSDDEVIGHGTDDSRFPDWVSFGDRKLLDAPQIIANAVVAKDGSGQFKKIQDAVNAVPNTNTQRFIIHVKAGIYNEVVQIMRKDNVFLIGDGIGKTIITGDLSFKKGVKTSATATVGVDSNFFMARGITFENSAGPDGHQAVALRINGEKAVIFESEMRGYQDTLYYHKGLQFYRNCIISGTVDFIFGNGRAIIQESTIIARKPGPSQSNMLTADGGLSPVGQHGLVIHNCNIIAEQQLMDTKAQTKTYLGRPWKEYAVTVFMNSLMGDFIFPAGYSVFTNVGEGSTNQRTAIYGEFMNGGLGSNTQFRDRQTFPKFKVLSQQEAEGYTVGRYIDGAAWLPATGVPFKVGLF